MSIGAREHLQNYDSETVSHHQHHPGHMDVYICLGTYARMFSTIYSRHVRIHIRNLIRSYFANTRRACGNANAQNTTQHLWSRHTFSRCNCALSVLKHTRARIHRPARCPSCGTNAYLVRAPCHAYVCSVLSAFDHIDSHNVSTHSTPAEIHTNT